MKLNAFFKLHILVSVQFAFLINMIESKQGWNTSGNGYIQYEAPTQLKHTRKLMINGTFATTKSNPNDDLILAVKDSNGNNNFTFSISKDWATLSINFASGNFTKMHLHDFDATSGKIFPFAIIIYYEPKDDNKGEYEFALEVGEFFGKILPNNTSTWNFERITLSLGGYKGTNKTQFQGCLSNFVFDGVSIIDTYFDQYPANENPQMVGDSNRNPEKCEDLNRILADQAILSQTDQTTNQHSKQSTTKKTANSSFRPEPIRVLAQLISASIVFRFKSIA